jgi:TPR repeat protein
MRFTLLAIWRAGFCAALAAWLMLAVLAGATVAGPYEDALTVYHLVELRIAAEQGHARAQYDLGNKYYLGEGVQRS